MPKRDKRVGINLTLVEYETTHTPFKLGSLLVLVAFLFASCTKQAENLEVPKVISGPSVEAPVVKVENGAMVFDNVEQMEKTILALFSMGEEQRSQFYDSVGFNSMDQIYREALAECSEFETFAEYQSARSKYDNLLLFDNDDRTNLAPELPMNNPLYAYVTNIKGDVMVAGESVNFSDVKSYSETPSAIAVARHAQTKTVVQDINYLYVVDGVDKKDKKAKRQIWATAQVVDDIVIIIVKQQVKSFWGWNVYKESYWLQAGNNHKVNAWNNYKLTFPIDNQWQVVGPVPDGDGIILGAKKPTYNIDEYIFLYANDMGHDYRGALIMKFPQTIF